MRIFYREQADKNERHYIHDALMDRDVLLHEVKVNAPTLELEIDEVSANTLLFRDLIFGRFRRDAAGHPKYAIDAAGDIVEKQDWEEWVDPEDGTEPPVLPPAVYVKMAVAVDADKARLRELNDQPSMTTAEKDEALGLMVKRSVD